MNSERLYRGSVRVLSALFVVLGVAIVAVTLTAGGGLLSTGLLMGVAFIGVGAARLWMASKLES